VQIPTFFLVGAPKSGTTSFFHYLAQHPDVAVASIKEPCYFAPESPVDPVTDACRCNWESYQSLFRHVRHERAVGEGSVAYLASAAAPAAIHARLPDAKILMMLRDPADRLFAHYATTRATTAATPTFREWVRAQHAIEATRSPVYGPIWAGHYATHLAHFRRVFSSAQIHVSFYEDFVTAPDAVLAAAFAFLGVDPAVTIERRVRHNETTVARWPALGPLRRPAGAVLARALPSPLRDRVRGWSRRRVTLTLPPDDRAHAIALYRDEIQALSREIGRDCSAWLRA
jgi:hypothetical protein